LHKGLLIKNLVRGVANIKVVRLSRILICIVFLFFSVFTIGVNADDTSVTCSPSSDLVTAGDTFTVDVMCNPTQDIKAFEFGLNFDASLLKANSVSEGDIFDGYSTFFDDGSIDNNAGTITNVFGLIMGQGVVSDAGSFVTISFTAKDNSGTSTLDLTGVGVTDEYGYISISVYDGSVEVEEDTGGGGDDPPSGGGNGGYTPPIPPPPENNPPETPMVPSGPTFVELGVEYQYSSSSFDIDGDLIKLQFDWGDGNYSGWSNFTNSNVTVNFTYSWNNTSYYLVKVIAQDENGDNSSWSLPLNISVSQTGMNGTPPVAIINFPENITANATVVFNASGSYDLDGSIVSYYWDFGDGESGNGVNPSHSYSVPGEYLVTLVVTDDSDNTYSMSMIITVSDELIEEKIDEYFVFPDYLIYILLSLMILMIASVTIYYRSAIYSFISNFNIDFGSVLGYLNIKGRIHNIDEKIETIKKEIDSRPDINQSYYKRAESYSTNPYNRHDEISRFIDKSKYSSRVDERSCKDFDSKSSLDRSIVSGETDNSLKPGEKKSSDTLNEEDVGRKIDEDFEYKIRIKIDRMFEDN